jgi:hypothetical protein
MEQMFIEILKASPGLAVAVFLVIIFTRSTTAKDVMFDNLFNRMEALHVKTLDSMTEITRNCPKNKDK